MSKLNGWMDGWMDDLDYSQYSVDLAAVGTNVHEKSRSDFCRLRFKTQGLSRMYALNRDVTAPGVVVYDSGMSADLVASYGLSVGHFAGYGRRRREGRCQRLVEGGAKCSHWCHD